MPQTLLMNTLKTTRIQSIDILRGLIMIIMALDHTRDYFHADAFVYDPLDLEKTTVILYFTRWITHFCAPIFILLAGTSAFISGQRKTKKELAIFLIKRGIWLIILEQTIVNFSWFFNLHFNFFIFGVIWVFGVCMIILAGLLFLPRKLMFWISLITIAGHNLLDPIHFQDNNASGFIWGMLHDRKVFSIGQVHIAEAYHIIPWAAVMALGYCLGPIFANGSDPVRRKKNPASTRYFLFGDFCSHSRDQCLWRPPSLGKAVFIFIELPFLYQYFQISTVTGLPVGDRRIGIYFSGADGTRIQCSFALRFRLWQGSTILLYFTHLLYSSFCHAGCRAYRIQMDCHDGF